MGVHSTYCGAMVNLERLVTLGQSHSISLIEWAHKTLHKRICIPITAMGFSTMFIFQLDITRR